MSDNAGATEPTSLLEPPPFDWDPWSIENLTDPYPMHHALRETAPVVWLTKYQMYAVGRHEESKTVLSDYTRFTSQYGTAIQDIRKPGNFRIPSRLVETDPPLHTRIRSAVNKVLSPLVIRRMREQFERTAEEFATRLVAQGEFDAVDELTEPYVVAAFPAAVGVNLRRTEALTIAEMRFNQSGPENELYHKAMKAAEPYMDWFDAACQREAVVPDSVADLLFKAEEAGEFDEGVASNIVRSFVGGGLDSTIAGIGHTLHHLARNPEQFAKIKADPKRIRGAFEEGVRMDTPFQFIWRCTIEDTQLGNYRLTGDAKVTVVMGSANRDPRKWQSPDSYDVTRETVGNYLGFGVAAHNCVGQMIARLEADAILTALVNRIDRMELADEPIYRPVNQMRVLGRLPLKVVAN